MFVWMYIFNKTFGQLQIEVRDKKKKKWNNKSITLQIVMYCFFGALSKNNNNEII